MSLSGIEKTKKYDKSSQLNEYISSKCSKFALKQMKKMGWNEYIIFILEVRDWERMHKVI